MRRADKEIGDGNLIASIMAEALVCRLAMAEDNMPYIVPMNFGYAGGTLYFHCASEGRKLDILARNPRVCFEVESRVKICSDDNNACAWGTRYYCVIGNGRAEIITDPHEKRQALDIIMRKYSGRNDWRYSEEALGNIKIIKVAVEQMTAKKSGW